MSYFDMFPEIDYNSKGDGKTTALKNLLSRVKIITDVEDNLFNFDYYDVKDGETPELIAHKYYGDINLHWTVLVANDIIDYYEDWPMSVQRFEEFVNKKYENPAEVHHYEIPQTSGDTTVMIDVGTNGGPNTDYPTATKISNYTYEDRLQEQKRQIRLIQPRFIDDFVKDFERKMNESL